MADVFISYAREDQAVVRRLHDELVARGHEVWVDWEGIEPSDRWAESIREAIDRADAVVFVVSPDSLASVECGREAEWAAAHTKRLVPVAVDDPPAGAAVPPAIAQLNWIFLRPQDDFGAGVDALVQAVVTDLELVRLHTRVLTRARAWELGGRRATPLLRGEELRQAESWVARAAGGVRPPPTELHVRFISASRRQASRRLRVALLLSLGVAALAVGLGAYAVVQRNDARHQASLALSRLLASAAVTDLDLGQPQPLLDRGVLLALEAYRQAPTTEARSSVLTALERMNRIEAMLHTGSPVRAVAYSADGRLVVTADDLGRIQLWDARSHRPLGPPLESRYVSAVALSPDGRTIAAGGSGRIVLWSVATRTRLGQPLPIPTPGVSPVALVTSLAFDRRSGVLASASDDGRIRLWDVRSRRLVRPPLQAREVGGGPDFTPVLAVAFSPDGRLVAGGADNGHVDLWPVAGGARRRLPATSGDPVRALAFGTGGTLAVGYATGPLQLWSVPSLRPLGPPLASPGGPLNGLAFAPRGDLVAAGYESGRVQLWEVAGRRAFVWFRADHEPVNSVAFSPDGGVLAAAGDDGRAVLRDTRSWDVFNATLARRLAGHGRRVTALAFRPDGKLLAAAAEDGTVRLLDPATGAESQAPLAAQALGLAFSPDGTRLAAADDLEIGLFDLSQKPAGRVVVASPGGPVVAVSFSPDGRVLAAGSQSGHILLLDAATHRRLGVLEIRGGIDAGAQSLAFSPDGSLLASGDLDGTVLLWQVRTHALAGRIATGSTRAVSGVAFTPSGRQLVTSDWDGTVRVFDVRRRAEIGSPLGEVVTNPIRTGAVDALALSPDGRTIAAVGNDGSVRLWDLSSQRLLGEALADVPASPANAVAFSPRGDAFAVGYDRPGVLLWDGLLWRGNEVGARARRLCEAVGRNLSRAEWSQVAAGAPYHRSCPQWP